VRVLALDVGDVYIGVAVSDHLGITAQGLNTIKRTAPEEDLQKILELIKNLSVSEVVIGLPRTLKGTSSIQTEKVKVFAENLKGKIAIPVSLWDERFTTKIALQNLKLGKQKPSRKKGLADRVAAMIILQDYLNFRKMRNPDV